MLQKDLNKRFKLLLYFSFACFLIISCKRKEIPNDLMGSPVLYFKGSINGDSLDMTAGNSYSEAWGSSEISSDGLLLFNGGISQSGNSPLGLSVILRDSIQRSSLTKEEALLYFKTGPRSWFYETETEAQTYSLVNFTAAPPPPGLDYQYVWHFEDGFISYFPSVTYRLQKNTLQAVKLIAFFNGNTDTLINYFETDENGLICPLQYNYYQTISGFTLNALPGFTNYLWTFPNGSTLTGENVTWTPLVQGANKIICSATGPNACNASFTRTIMAGNTGNAGADFTHKFIAAFNEAEVKNNGLNQVEIQLKGNWKGQAVNYSSKKPKNNFPASNLFYINKAEPFADYKGTPTIKVEMNFSGYLYNVLNLQDSIFIESKKMVMAFGYKAAN